MNHDERRVEKTDVIRAQNCGAVRWNLLETIQLKFPQCTGNWARHTPRTRLQLRRTAINIARLPLSSHYINTPNSDAASLTSKPR